MIVKILNSKKLIEEACALLYDLYIEHMKWNFSKDNPSQIKVIIKNNKKMLVDKHTNDAIWFGAFDGEVLVGCLRLSGVDENNKFEIEGYPSSKAIRKHIPTNKHLCMDITKLAVHLAYPNKSTVIQHLFLNLLKHCSLNKYSAIAFTHDSYLKSLFTLVNFPLVVEHAFKFEETDPMPVNFYRACFETGEIEGIISKLEHLISRSSKPKLLSMLEMLEIVAPAIPALIYWHDKDGVVLGLNQVCLEEMGAKNFSDIIGKNPYDFYPRETAEYILGHNQQVMNSGEVSYQEESINDITTGKYKVFKSIKAPLYDNNGNVIGIIGTSVNITAEKEAEKLMHDNLAQQTIIDGTKNFRQFLNKIVNEIQNFRIEDLSEKLGIKPQVNLDEPIRLTKRESEVLYFLSLNKSPKDIATIITALEEKPVADSTINGLINKQLYPKFKVFNIGQLIEKANVLKLIPFLPDN